MTPDAPTARIKRSESIDYEPVGPADGLSKGVLIDESDGAPNFAIRRFTLDPGATVPRHTNQVEHEQYVLEGEYTVGIEPPTDESDADDEGTDVDRTESAGEYTVAAGDALFIPPGTVHWYRNDGDEPAAFLCAVPNGDDAIELLEA
ncbi:MAG: cupin domain-containing protein [Halobacteriota archaeon]